jgi:hypothetical protein
MVIMFVIGGLSAFIPVALEVCRRTGASPGRIQMPMSHKAGRRNSSLSFAITLSPTSASTSP